MRVASAPKARSRVYFRLRSASSNDGTGEFKYLADALPENLLSTADSTLALGVGDLNGDGKMDIVTGQGEGTITSGNATSLRLNRGCSCKVAPCPARQTRRNTSSSVISSCSRARC